MLEKRCGVRRENDGAAVLLEKAGRAKELLHNVLSSLSINGTDKIIQHEQIGTGK